MHLSRVDLPEPLRPRMPTVSPSSTVSDTSFSAQKSSVGLALAAVDDALLDGVVLPVGQAEALRDVADVDGEVAHRSELLGEVALEPAEHGEGDEEEDDGEEQHAEDQGGVPEVALGREDLGDDAVDGHDGVA